MTDKLAVFFPGQGYTCQEDLIKGCIDIYQAKGYKTVILDFGGITFSKDQAFSLDYEKVKPLLKSKLAPFFDQRYKDLVFVSKSFGTLCAVHADQDFILPARHLFLTPLPETLALIQDETQIIAMVIGSQDRFLAAQTMLDFCSKRHIQALLFEGTGHRLKYPDDNIKTAKLNQQIFELCA